MSVTGYFAPVIKQGYIKYTLVHSSKRLAYLLLLCPFDVRLMLCFYVRLFTSVREMTGAKEHTNSYMVLQCSKLFHSKV